MTDTLASTLCSAEITFKTDPKNTDYAAEHGASRNFEPWRDEREVEEEDRLAKLEEEENNPMKALENRTTDSKREMDILDALQDIRARNARNERVAHGDGAELLDRLARDEVEEAEERERRLAEEEDEKLVREVFSVAGASHLDPSRNALGETLGEPSAGATTKTVGKRRADEAEPELHSLLTEQAKSLQLTKGEQTAQSTKKRKVDQSSMLGIRVVKGKRKIVV